MTWLEMYHEYTKEAEPITAYHEWAGLFCISSALSARCWTNLGFGKIYPNLYVVLVGLPAKTRKGAAIEIACSMLQPLEDEFLIYTSSESITGPKLIHDMQETKTMVEIDDKPYEYMGLAATSSELATFLKRNADDLVTLLIELFDGKAKYRHGTIKHSTKHLKNTCLNMLAGTVPSFFQATGFEAHINTGLTSRCIFIYADDRRWNKADPYIDEKLHLELIGQLRKMTEICGLIPLSHDANKYFNLWYEKLPQNPKVIPALMPYYGRKQMHVRTVAMLCTAMDIVKGAKQVTEIKHLQSAIEIVKRAEELMAPVFKKTGRVVGLKDIDDIKETVKKAKGWITYGDIVRKHHYDISMDPNVPGGIMNILDNLVNTLKVVERKTEGKQLMFRWRGRDGA